MAKILVPTKVGSGARYVTCRKNNLGEYVCRLYVNGKHYKPADYFTDDAQDASDTAQAMVIEPRKNPAQKKTAHFRKWITGKPISQQQAENRLLNRLSTKERKELLDPERISRSYLKSYERVLKRNPDKPRYWTVNNTELEEWNERDRLHIGLREKGTDNTIADWWDDDVRSMFEDGFFNNKRLHQSVVDYANDMSMKAKKLHRYGKRNPGKKGFYPHGAADQYENTGPFSSDPKRRNMYRMTEKPVKRKQFWVSINTVRGWQVFTTAYKTKEAAISFAKAIHKSTKCPMRIEIG